MNMLLKPLISPEEFETLPGFEHFELIDGQPKEKAMGAESSWVQRRLNFFLSAWADDGPRGYLFESECAYRCFPHRPRLVRKPDVSFVHLTRLPSLPLGQVRIVPDLVVEVISPNDFYSEVEDKIDDYLKVAVPLIWIVNPRTRTVYAYESRTGIRRLTETDELEGGTVLPGFRVALKDIFPTFPAPAEDAPSDEQPS